MRHQNRVRKLGRTSAHRKATLRALAGALIEHKHIHTTITKAKALRTFIEPLITRAKEDNMQNRRTAFRYLNNKYAVTELFTEIAEKVGDRKGGYTRVIRIGRRAGDAAEMALIELVDYNDIRPDGSSERAGKTKRTRRSRRGKGTSAAASVAGETPVETTNEESAE